MEISRRDSQRRASLLAVSLVRSSVAGLQPFPRNRGIIRFHARVLERVLEHDSIVSAIQLIIQTSRFLPRERRLWKLLDEDWGERNISCNDKCRGD